MPDFAAMRMYSLPRQARSKGQTSSWRRPGPTGRGTGFTAERAESGENGSREPGRWDHEESGRATDPFIDFTVAGGVLRRSV
jgi:hypothetical protein